MAGQPLPMSASCAPLFSNSSVCCRNSAASARQSVQPKWRRKTSTAGLSRHRSHSLTGRSSASLTTIWASSTLVVVRRERLLLGRLVREDAVVGDDLGLLAQLFDPAAVEAALLLRHQLVAQALLLDLVELREICPLARLELEHVPGFTLLERRRGNGSGRRQREDGSGEVWCGADAGDEPARRVERLGLGRLRGGEGCEVELPRRSLPRREQVGEVLACPQLRQRLFGLLLREPFGLLGLDHVHGHLAPHFVERLDVRLARFFGLERVEAGEVLEDLAQLAGL